MNTELIAKLAGLVALLDIQARANDPAAATRRKEKYRGLDEQIRQRKEEFVAAAVAEFRAAR